MGVQLPKGEQHKVSQPQNQRAAGWKKSNKRAILRALVADQPQLVTYTRTSVDDRVDSSGGMWKSGSEQLLQCFHTT